MPKPYDASLRALIDQFLPDWLALVPRRPIGPVRIIDANLSTVTAEADKVLLVEDPQPWILHLELQSSWDDSLPARVAWYNAMLGQCGRARDARRLDVLSAHYQQSAECSVPFP